MIGKFCRTPEERAERDAQRAAEGRVRWSYDVKGRLLTIREGLTVVPYQQVKGGWYAVVVEATTEADQRAYPRGGFNILVTDDDVETAVERVMA